MDPRFTEYGSAVCTYIRHATSKEKAAIRKELADHMEDHALALMNAGYDEEHSARVALESMGDPETVGRELDKAYPLRWLVLSRTALVVLVVLWLAILALACSALPTVAHNIQAHYFPRTLTTHTNQISGKLLWDLPGDRVLSVYAVDLSTLENGSYSALVHATSYSTHLSEEAGDAQQHLTLSTPGQDATPSQVHFSPTPKARVCIYPITLAWGDSIRVTYDHGGISHEGLISIPWEEVSIP